MYILVVKTGYSNQNTIKNGLIRFVEELLHLPKTFLVLNKNKTSEC